jgi:hypothetical protein
MKIKLFTMVKNEDDIVEYWIQYHGEMFGYNNLYIVDNESTDGTYEKIQKYSKYGVHISREHDYSRKGEIMTELMNDTSSYDIAFPLDIDEFVIYYDKETNTVSPEKTLPYLKTLVGSDKFKDNSIFKANYIYSTITNGNNIGYENALFDCKHGQYLDYGHMAKTFINKHKWEGVMDHGNHFPTENYIPTNICLIHYHCRNIEQMKKKVKTNVEGLGYPSDDLEFLKNLPKETPGCHHVRHMIQILKNSFTINTNFEITNEHIPLKPFIFYLKKHTNI